MRLGAAHALERAVGASAAMDGESEADTQRAEAWRAEANVKREGLGSHEPARSTYRTSGDGIWGARSRRAPNKSQQAIEFVDEAAELGEGRGDGFGLFEIDAGVAQEVERPL